MRLGRNYESHPFPKSGSSIHPGSGKALDLIESLGFSVTTLAGLPSQRSIDLDRLEGLPRSWLLDPEVRIGWKDGESLLVCLDLDDQLSVRDSRAGLALQGLERVLLDLAVHIDGKQPATFDPEFGFLCARIVDCGSGVGFAVLLHLPALAKTGLMDRILREVLGRGWSLEGFYGFADGSAGDLWMLSAGDEGPRSREELEAEVRFLARAEDRARTGLLEASRPGLYDLAGRAVGILSYAQSLPVSELLQLLSDLRLGILTGVVVGWTAGELGDLMPRLVASSRRSASGRGVRSGLDGRTGSDSERASSIREALYLPEPAPGYRDPLRSKGLG
jgi:protein arginine kinase